ncbi:hypothetical protein [Prosthecobacter dejongeii]|uniref:Tape measure domain-containing protein n=1 Tax=Prosthecobacter dejongeii TaxID=48465 RepID=A0A7W8DQK1_9BACT|nr:hypothetical protein [Prosthecobacter dejongeii]MBB5038270.1 hypothetical protein [Prosthecobacter dejongeii]
MSAIVSALRLEIAEYQQNLAKARGDAAKLKEDLMRQSAGIEQAILGKTERYQAIINKVRTDAMALKRELSQAQSQLLAKEALRVQNPDFRSFHRHVETEGRKAGASLAASMRGGLNSAGGLVAGGIATTLAAVGSVGSRGGNFNLTLDNAEVGIANVLRRFDGLNAAAAKNEAAKALERIIELEPITAGGLEDLTLGFMKTLATAKGIGLTTMQNVELTAKFANAVANAGLPLDQLTQEYRSILSGNITKDSQIAKILGITNEEVNRIKSSGGDMFAFLTDKLGEFGEAGDGAQVAFSSFGSAVSKTFGNLTQGGFDEAVSSARELAEWLEGNADASREAGDAIGDYLYVFRDGFKNLSSEILNDPKIKQLAKLNPFAGVMPSKDDIDTARLADEQARRNSKADTLQRHADDPNLTEEQRAKILEKIAVMRQQDLDVETEAAKIREETGVSFVESLRQARELVELRESSRASEQQSANQNSEEASEASIKAKEKVVELQQRIAEEEMKALPPAERYRAAAEAQAAIFEEMQKTGGLFFEASIEGMKELVSLRFTRGNFEGALQAMEQLNRAQDLAKVMSEADQQAEDSTSKTDKERDQAREKKEREEKSTAAKLLAENKLRQKRAEALADFHAEMDILKAQADGRKELAEQLQRDLDVQELKRRIIEQTNVSEAEALRMARERIDLQQRIKEQQSSSKDSRYDENGRRVTDGRKRIDAHIRTPEEGGPDRGPSGLSDFYRDQTDPSRGKVNTPGLDAYDTMQKTRLKDTFKTPGLDAYDELQRKKNRDQSQVTDQAKKNEAAANATPQDSTAQVTQIIIQTLPEILARLSL